MDLVKFLEKKSKTSHFDHRGHIKGDIMQNLEQKKKVKKVKIQDSMGKTNFFLSTLLDSPLAVLATWLLPKKYKENEHKTHFEQNCTMGSYRVGIGHAWHPWKACEICGSLIQKKKMDFLFYFIFHTSCNSLNLVSRNFKVLNVHP
jgi:hypothetical protein